MKKTNYSLQEMEEKLYVAVISDALDGLGFTAQSPDISFSIHTGKVKLVGRCKTTLWSDLYHMDPNPYELELKAVDDCQPGEIFIAAAAGSNRSGIWGELLSTAARNSGCTGALVDGSIRDISKINDMGFTVFAKGKRVYDSQNRQRVIDIDVPVEIGGVRFCPGDLVFCDEDGVVVIPQEVEEAAIEKAMLKVNAENITRDEIKKGMKATDAYKKYGVL
ncbi:RraA family protein [Cyclobacterium jeungdonense]|uniref:Putative 4-hydroxy-4-methyl-2-oxoglutarate aldolase n=1 Tax=Cyclobacterium jeungdonense TaxID=708087 RepID=A0ABT8C2N5_9BACT|nr:RraA family protein [Cyclobacterium jeungdonense]MDN3687053.1 RraA family protein [Cyclobacterium jeungdonense]